MLRLSRTTFLVGLAVGCCLALTPQTGRSQGAKGANVQFNTADGVTIKGSFYAGKRDSTCVMMLHALGTNEDSNKQGWQQLAKALNAKGYAVLTFDFRGHGDSTDINPKEFWVGKAGAVNMQLVKGFGRPGDNIDFKDFNKGYYPTLVNDIAAAKAFLDRKNDTGDCNSSSLVVIGAETGATLGAIWANSEFLRYHVEMAQGFVPGQPFPIQQVKVAKDSEGKNTLACVWLSISPTLGAYKVNLSGQVGNAAKTHDVAMAFFHGADDAEGDKLAKALEKSIKFGAKKGSKYAFTAPVPIPGAGDKLRGRGLLEVGGAEKAIVDYVENVSSERPREWTEREFKKSCYVWRLTSGYQPAKYPGEMTMIFQDYRLYPFFYPKN